MTYRKMAEIMLVIAIVLSNLSQIPALFGNSTIKLGYTVSWLLALIILLIANKFILHIRYLLLPIVFDIFCLLGSMFGKTYLSSTLFIPINMSAFILIVGILLGSCGNENSVKKIAICYIITSVIVGVVLYFTVFRGVDWSGSSVYLYKSKNSAGQFLLSGLVLLATMFYKKNRLLCIPIIGFYTLLILMMKSRTTIVALTIYLVYFIFGVIESKKERNFYLIVLVVFGLLVIFQPDLNNFIINEIIFNNRDMSINSLSSGRDVHWKRFAQEFGDYMFVGTGGTYLESMPLAVLFSYGIIGGIPVLLFAIEPFWYAANHLIKKERNIYTILVFSISLVMFINGIFEEQAPFGPGVKCYLTWLLFGMLIGRNSNKLKKYNGDGYE